MLQLNPWSHHSESIHLSIYPSTHLPIVLSFCLSFYLSVSVGNSIVLLLCHSVILSFNLSYHSIYCSFVLLLCCSFVQYIYDYQSIVLSFCRSICRSLHTIALFIILFMALIIVRSIILLFCVIFFLSCDFHIISVFFSNSFVLFINCSFVVYIALQKFFMMQPYIKLLYITPPPPHQSTLHTP